MKILVCGMAAVGLALPVGAWAQAPEAGAPLVVAVKDIPPLVEVSGQQVSGFDVDLVRAVAAGLGRPVEFRVMDSMTNLLGAVERGEVDLAASGITVTAEREQQVDFSHATMNSGLHIAVRGTEEEASIFATVAEALLTWEMAKTLGILALFLLCSGAVLWCIELGSGSLPNHPRDGIPVAAWLAWAVMTTIGFGDVTPKRKLGRLATVPIFFVGILVSGVVTSQITAAMTIQKIEATGALVQGPDDLRRRSAATVAGTTSVAALDDLGAHVREAPTLEAAFALLEGGEVDAVVYDAPAILSYVNGAGKGRVRVAGGLFDKQDYGFAFPPGSALREPANRALLGLRKDGTYDKLHRKHFGD